VTGRRVYRRETTGLLPRLHWPVYDNHHFDGKRLNEEKNLLDWLDSNGVDGARFKQAYESYEVTQKVNEARKMLDTYNVKGVPSLVVDGRLSPVIQDESDEARKTAAPAMSFGCPIRPSGVCASTCLRISLSAIPAECVPSVSTMPEARTSSMDAAYRHAAARDSGSARLAS